MAEAVHIQAALTKSDLRRWLLGRLVRRPVMWWLPLAISTALAIARSIVTPQARGLPGWFWISHVAGGYAIIGICAFAGSVIQMLIAIARLKADGMYLEPKRITVDDDGIACVGDANTNRTSWKLVERLRLRAVGLEFALRDPRNGALLIPRRALDDATIAGIEALFARSRAT